MPRLDVLSIYAKLDDLADQMRDHLGINTREGDELPESVTSDLKVFLERVCECFSKVLKFKGNSQDYYTDANRYEHTYSPQIKLIPSLAICQLYWKRDLAFPSHYVLCFRPSAGE